MSQNEDTTRYRNDISRYYSKLSKEQECALSKRILKGDDKAIHELVMANLPLVVHFARRYSSLGMTQNDIIQEGNIGLIRAARCYDYRKKTRFSTHAAWYIFGSILRALEDKSRLVRIPGNFHYAEMKMRRQYEKAMREGKAFNDTLPGDKYSEYDPGNYEFQNIPLEKAYMLKCSDDGASASIEAREEVSRLMKCLSPEEKAAVSLYFGLGDRPNQNFREISHTLGISQSKAKGLIARAFVKMGRLAAGTTRKPTTPKLCSQDTQVYLR